MSEVIEGVIRGKTIELEMDPGLRDGERVEVVIRRAGPTKAWGDGIKATAGALADLPAEYFEDLDEIVRDRPHWNFAQMHHHEWCIEPFGKINCLEGVFQCSFAFVSVRRRKLIAIGRRLQNFNWQRAKIVQTGKFHFAGFEHLLNARHQRNPDAVAEFDSLKTEIENFLEHVCAVGMAA